MQQYKVSKGDIGTLLIVWVVVIATILWSLTMLLDDSAAIENRENMRKHAVAGNIAALSEYCNSGIERFGDCVLRIQIDGTATAQANQGE